MKNVNHTQRTAKLNRAYWGRQKISMNIPSLKSVFFSEKAGYKVQIGIYNGIIASLDHFEFSNVPQNQME